MPILARPDQLCCSDSDDSLVASDSEASISSLSEHEVSPMSTPSEDRHQVCTSELVSLCLRPYNPPARARDGEEQRSEKGNVRALSFARPLAPQLTDVEAKLAVSVSTWRMLTDAQRARMGSKLVSRWLTEADYQIRAMGWQRESILTVPHLVMLHGLLRRIIAPHPASLTRVEDVRSLVLVCFYIVCSYAGQEISYPYRPFANTADRVFWARCVPTACAVSGELLRLTTDMSYYDAEHQHLRQSGMEAIGWRNVATTKKIGVLNARSGLTKVKETCYSILKERSFGFPSKEALPTTHK